MSTARLLVFSCLALTLAACDGGLHLAEGERCYGDDECASGMCNGVCVEPCTSDADCATGVCAGNSFSTSGPFCVSDCSASLAAGWYCASGVPTRCENGGAEADCRSCGCPSGQFCDEFGTNACAAPREVGEPCTDHAECASRNCGHIARDAKICFAAAGQPCDGASCGECVIHEGGGSECLQACGDSLICGGEEDDALCWGSVASDDGFYCRTPCSEFDPNSCPDGFTCRRLEDRSFRTFYRCYPDSVDVGLASHGCESGAVADACGVCDDDPTNDCVRDCAGRWGGTATADMCGTCDADPDNDCVQDCEGTWGGPATVDPCGTCDSDPDNDGNVDPCGVCDTDPTNDCVPRCDYGDVLLGGCWFVSGYGRDCVAECYSNGGRYSEQTRRVAGSDGSIAACRTIIDAIGPTITSVGPGVGHGGIGCAFERAAVFGGPAYGYHHTDQETTSSASFDDFARLCACEF